MTVLRVALVELKRLTSGVLPVLVLLAMSCIPLLYGALYLYGNWDAYGHVNGIVGAWWLRMRELRILTVSR